MSNRVKIPVREETREQYLKPCKRGGESWDALLQKMAAQYEPEEPDIPEPEATP